MFVFEDGDGQDVISDFDAVFDMIEINGTIVDPNAAGTDITLSEQADNVLVAYGHGDLIVLEDTTIAEWQAS